MFDIALKLSRKIKGNDWPIQVDDQESHHKFILEHSNWGILNIQVYAL